MSYPTAGEQVALKAWDARRTWSPVRDRGSEGDRAARAGAPPLADPAQRPPADVRSGPKKEIPLEHAITRLYLLPAGSADEFMAELEDDSEEPTLELRALLGVVAG